MEEMILDISSCTSALQFLDTLSKALGKPLGTFSMLNHHLLPSYYPKITFLGMKKGGIRCPQATKEIETILNRVQWHYQQKGKEFEYGFQS